MIGALSTDAEENCGIEEWPITKLSGHLQDFENSFTYF
jgi:hypothetical protein